MRALAAALDPGPGPGGPRDDRIKTPATKSLTFTFVRRTMTEPRRLSALVSLAQKRAGRRRGRRDIKGRAAFRRDEEGSLVTAVSHYANRGPFT